MSCDLRKRAVVAEVTKHAVLVRYKDDSGFSCQKLFRDKSRIEVLEQEPSIEEVLGHLEEQGYCRFFLEGRCRFRKKCHLCHELGSCPYCHETLPTHKVSASAHLRRCWRHHSSDSTGGETTSSGSSPVELTLASSRATSPDFSGTSTRESCTLS